jgi:hypothetical protein
MPQINYFFSKPDYYYEFENEDISLGMRHPQSGKYLTFFEILTGNMLNDLFIDRVFLNLKIIAVTKDGPNIYLLADNRMVVHLKLKSTVDQIY